MDYSVTAKEIIRSMGGEKNIKSVTHCMTRLRFVLHDDTGIDQAQIKAITGVLGLMVKGGQYQVIIGNDVAKCYKEILKLGDFAEKKTDQEVKGSIFNALMDYISGSMSPLIPALVGGGMIKVIVMLLEMAGILSADMQTHQFLSFFGDTPFYFMPIMLAYTAAAKFKVNQMLAVTIAGIMIHPSFISLVGAGEPIALLGLPVTAASYSSSVIPILMMVWVMKYVERFLDQVIPPVIKSFAQPIIFIVVCGALALIVIGPIGTYVGQGLSAVVVLIKEHAGWLALALMGAFMPLIVMTGMHWAFAPIFLIASIETPDSLILPAMLASNLAQASACLAVVIKTKNKDMKQIAGASSISAFLAGVTEPALYGVTLKLKKPLYACMIAGGIAGLYAGITGLESYTFAVPALASIPQFAAEGRGSNLVNACIVAAISIVATFVLTWLFGFEDPSAENEGKKEEKQLPDSVNSGLNDTSKVFSPLKGQMITLSEVKDEAFSSGMMGKGVAIIPEEGRVTAPISGRIEALFPTRHAIGIVGSNGIQVMVHVGMDTVKLDGQHFEALVGVGDEVTIGQDLIVFDMEKITAEGYSLVTPVIITNTHEFVDVIPKEPQRVVASDCIIVVI
ncbi:MAG: beta-glucoside-specific PTS transporter subunit IIABC [Lachnospiraceae bacterium]